MPANPEYGSQEHNKPKHNEVEGENVVFKPAELQEASERLGKPPPPTSQDPAELDRRGRRRAYMREWMRRWRKEHPEQNREKNRKAVSTTLLIPEGT